MPSAGADASEGARQMRRGAPQTWASTRETGVVAHVLDTRTTIWCTVHDVFQLTRRLDPQGDLAAR
jgi:hypothetical protein